LEEGQDRMEDAQKFPTWNIRMPISFVIMHINPDFFEQPTFLTFPLFIAPSPYSSTVCLWISARQTFSGIQNCITNHTSQVAEFLIFNNYSEWWWGDMIVYAIRVFPLTYERRLTFTGNVCVTCACAIHNQFWLPVQASYIEGIDVQTWSCYKTTRWNGTWSWCVKTAKQHSNKFKIEVTFDNSGGRGSLCEIQ
jgi:hypothetical protein